MEIKAGDPIVLETCTFCKSTDITIIIDRSVNIDGIRILSCNECGCSYHKHSKSS